ncbi:Crp/Fnr family transcriptional regulator [Paraburkholderia sp. SOS3]|uniref:Crp/Fnr family transcriptional regulator n=1 Tax=Paraburkholderia sp. SOS3 TaxID=1926494 RepID=UPI0009473842|nr:Crp/Fnr family transcriptional regulator [Paraburkholderia sp. SOS3]APR35624.1 Crp/Fnr family transcriptional regulator [Paraburkholderia sp. SOS3]
MWFVGKSELLSLIERNCLEEVMPAFSDHRSLRKNALVYRPEERSEYVYLLKVGHVRLYRLTEDGQEITLSFIKAGMIFGDGDVLNEANYSHYAQTLAESRICYIRKADFKDLLTRYDAINQFVLRSHHQRWQEAQKLIENLSLHDVRKRLVNILSMFATQIGTSFAHGGRAGAVLIDLSIAQDKLAEFIGTSRESVNRHFSDLKAEGLVDTHERKIVLTPAFVAQFLPGLAVPAAAAVTTAHGASVVGAAATAGIAATPANQDHAYKAPLVRA